MTAEGEHLAAEMKNKESAQSITGESAQMKTEEVSLGVELTTEKAAKTRNPVETITEVEGTLQSRDDFDSTVEAVADAY